jgi:hypothetical protein
MTAYDRWKTTPPEYNTPDDIWPCDECGELYKENELADMGTVEALIDGKLKRISCGVICYNCIPKRTSLVHAGYDDKGNEIFKLNKEA